MTEFWSHFNLIINKVVFCYKWRLQAASSRPQIHRDIHRSELRSSPVALGVLTTQLTHPDLGGSDVRETGEQEGCDSLICESNVPKDCFLRTLFHTCALRKQKSGASGENEPRVTQWIPESWQSQPSQSQVWPSSPADLR